MANRWDFRAVEGALYGLRGVVGRQPSAPPIERPVHPQPAGPASQPAPSFGESVGHSLSPDEVQDIRDHYILGVKRHGYKRRAHIIKKIVATLNDDEVSSG